MGGTNSKGRRLFSESLIRFSDIEKDSIHKLYTSLSVDKKGFNCTHFVEFTKGKLTKDFASKLFSASLHMKEGSSPDGHVNLLSFAKILTVLLKGDQEEAGQFLLQMMGSATTCTNQNLKQFLNEISLQFLSLVQANAAYQSWNFKKTQDTSERLVKMLYFDLLNKRKNVNDLWQSTELVFNENELQQMFFGDTLLTKVFKSITSDVFPVLENRTGSLLPECEELDEAEPSALLDLPSVIMLNQNLPAHLKNSWRLLYSTSLHGQSFSMMLGRLLQKGPSLIVLKDKEGHLFGGFSSQHWDLKPTFTGKEDTFVFTLFPNPAVYSSTGYNANYTYLCLHQHTLPNGMGFGGQLNNFGLWLDGEFEEGHSTPACSTFSSPQLSGSRRYKLDELQAWGVGPQDPEKEVLKEKKKKTILDADVGAKAILTMVNKIGASDGIREEDEQREKEAALKENL